MSVILAKVQNLIWQNRSKTGGTKLLTRGREIESSDKIQDTIETYNGHFKSHIQGSDGELYEVWLFQSGKVFCSCAFFADLEPFQRQALGCKHVLAHSLRVMKQLNNAA